MALILNIETATAQCSVVLSRDGHCLDLEELREQNAHGRILTVFIDKILKRQGLKSKDLDAIAVSMGPGSYTGLRIGVSTAKGLCYALDKPLIAVATLQSMALNAFNAIGDVNAWYCPMIDARRMEVYTAMYDASGQIKRVVSAEVIDNTSFQNELQQKKIYFFGDGAAKCKEAFASFTNAVFLEDWHISATGMIKLAEEAFIQQRFENVAYFEPLYLKEFVTGTQRKGMMNQDS